MISKNLGKIMRPFILFLVFCSFSKPLHSTPEKKVPTDLWQQFTMDNQIPVLYWYFDNSTPNSEFEIVL